MATCSKAQLGLMTDELIGAMRYKFHFNTWEEYAPRALKKQILEKREDGGGGEREEKEKQEKF